MVCTINLIQYVDGLLVCSDMVEQCKEDTVTLLTALAEKGHKVNKSKLQLWKDKVDYLRHTLMAGKRGINVERVAAIRAMPKPRNKKEMRQFQGMIGYCRQWIVDYVVLSRPLYGSMLEAAPTTIEWTERRI